MLFFSLSSYSQNFKGFSIGPETQIPLSYNTGNYFYTGYGVNLTIPIMTKSNFDLNSSIGIIFYEMKGTYTYGYSNGSDNEYSSNSFLSSVPFKIMPTLKVKRFKFSLVSGFCIQRHEIRETLSSQSDYVDYHATVTYLVPLILGAQIEAKLFGKISAYTNIESKIGSTFNDVALFEYHPNKSLNLPIFVGLGLKYNL